MAAKKKAEPAPDIMVAKCAILIDGKPFEAGQPVDGVDSDQIKVAVAARRVVPASEYDGPEWSPPVADEADADKGEGA